MLVKIENILGHSCKELLLAIGESAAKNDLSCYLIGGIVRDMLLGISSSDLDIMVEGDATKFIELLRSDWNTSFSKFPSPQKSVSFKRYKTGKLIFDREVVPGVFRIDFSSARDESYSSIGAKPEISFSDLADDLKRRDFTINAMAISLNRENCGELIDKYGGSEDLAKKQIRILHKRSFEDDPARLLRAVRFTQRLDFQLEKATSSRFASAVENNRLASLPRFRLFDEFGKALEESKVTSILWRLETEGMLQQIDHRLSMSEEIAERIEEIRKLKPAKDSVRPLILSVLCSSFDDTTYRSLLNSFECPKKQVELFVSVRG